MKIVLAVDGSKYGRWATEWITKAPFAQRPEVTAVHVVDVAALRAPFMVQPVMMGYEGFIRDEERRLETRAKRVASETKKFLEAGKIRTKALIEKGAVAMTVLKHTAGRVGLVVVGHRGMDALDRFFLGSVATKVSLHAPCSVLVVMQAPRPIRRVLLAVDGSKASDRALQFLLRYFRPATDGKHDRIEVTVLHVIPAFAYSRVTVAGMALTHRYAQKLHKAGYRVKEAFKPGNPADEIIKGAHRRRADLVVAGAQGMGAVGRFLLGSVSARLVKHSPCSTLIVR